MGYKYTFLDWFTGKIETDKLQELIDNNQLDPEAHLFINKYQTTMFIAFIGSLFEHRKMCFYFQCKHSIAEDELIENEIEIVSRQIDLFKQTYPAIYNQVLLGVDNRFSLSSEQLFNLISDPSKINFDGTAYDLSIKLKYRRWLEWFKNDRYNPKTEPFFKLPYPVKEFWEQFQKYMPVREQSEGGKEFYDTINKQLIESHVNFTTNKLNETLKNSFKTALSKASQEVENKNLKGNNTSHTWSNMFRDPEQADKILVLISEYLTDAGQWNTGKAGRHLMALYSELKEKGYLKQNLSGPIIANSINNQFGTNLTFRNFQPGELEKAVDYRDNFKHIPANKPTPKHK